MRTSESPSQEPSSWVVKMGFLMGRTSVLAPSAETTTLAFMESGEEGISFLTSAGSFSSIVGPKGLFGLFA